MFLVLRGGGPLAALLLSVVVDEASRFNREVGRTLLRNSFGAVGIGSGGGGHGAVFSTMAGVMSLRAASSRAWVKASTVRPRR